MTHIARIVVFLLVVCSPFRMVHPSEPDIPVVDSPERFSCSDLEIQPSPDFDWSDYSAKMVTEIRKNWKIPREAKGGVEGLVNILFVISPAGDLVCMEFQERSKHPNLDVAAWNAIAGSQPFPPLPTEAPVTIGEVVRISFRYNNRGSGKEGIQFDG